jgi:hypothetical protein
VQVPCRVYRSRGFEAGEARAGDGLEATVTGRLVSSMSRGITTTPPPC